MKKLKKVYKIKLKKGDTVTVRSGKHKGKSGQIVTVHPALNKVTVEGINIVKKHQKPTKQHPQGGIIELTKPIWVGKVGVIDPSTKKISRIASGKTKEGKKIRVYAKSKKEVR